MKVSKVIAEIVRARAARVKCVTCKESKDPFSREWEYQECQNCSMAELFPYRGV